MADQEARAFGRKLTVILVLLGILTAGSVLLFGHLLFKALRKDVVEDALVKSRLDAERIALGVSQRAAGDLYTLRYKQKEIDNFVGSTLAERQVLNDVQVLDKNHNVIYSFGSVLRRQIPASGNPETPRIEMGPAGMPKARSQTTEMPIADPYAIEVPIGDLFVLRAGVSRKELEARVEKLRVALYLRTAAAAVVSLLGIAAASSAVILLFRRTRKVEEARIEAERRAELGEVAAGLAHEIRNPLNAMGLNLELLEEQIHDGRGSPAQAAELAAAARVETGRLAKLLTDFLAYARPAPVVPQKSDLNEPASEAVGFLMPEAAQRKIRLTFEPHPGGALAKLDEARVKQVVLNLVANALDAVEAEGATGREVDVSVGEADGMWRLTVEDRGPGVPAHKRSEIFRAFVSTKPAGTGLGLPIAERIVKAHGGSLTLESRPGEPTRAVATFPKP